MTRNVRLLLWGAVAVVVTAVAVVTALVVAGSDDGARGGAAQPLPGSRPGPAPDGCDLVVAYFRTDEEMSSAAAKARALPGVASVRAQTKAENHARFTEIFADEPDLLETVTPESLPASIEARPTDASDTDRLESKLGEEFPAAELQAIPCP